MALLQETNSFWKVSGTAITAGAAELGLALLLFTDGTRLGLFAAGTVIVTLGLIAALARGPASPPGMAEPAPPASIAARKTPALMGQPGPERADRERAEQELPAQQQSRLIDAFNDKLGGVIDTVITSATRLEADSHELSAVAEQTEQQVTAVSAASEQAAANVQTVAAATEQLAASSREISEQVGRASTIATNATANAEQPDRLVRGLAEASGKIDDVVKLIREIAGRTNLLALNATIEAARAGEAGRGFAVVAGEVKTLANQTARATGDISAQIGRVQQQTAAAVEAIGTIANTIREFDLVSSAITAAVEQQGAATREITHNVQEAHLGTVEVARNVMGIGTGARQSTGAAREVLHASQALLQQAESMRSVSDNFLISLQSSGGSLEWGPSWISGHEVIDRDHKMLVQYVNELNQAMLQGAGHDAAGAVLDKLAQYTVDHFAREETIWSEAALPSLAEHRRLHADLVEKVVAFQNDFRAGRASLTTELMSFLREWLINHVFKTDKAAVKTISARAA